MVNFSVAVIAKNEVKTLPKLVKSLEDFQKRGGEIVVYDTGSTDGTPELARSLGCKTVEVGGKHIITITAETAKAINDTFIIDNDEPIMKEGNRIFNYAEARNAAAEHCSNDMVAMPDCDEAYTRLDIDRLESIINQGYEQLEYNFVFSHDSFNNPLIKFLHCKFYNKKKLKWTGIIHEVITGNAKRTFLGEDIIYLEHWQNMESPRGHYLTGLAYDHWLRPDYDRNAHYFGRELLWSSRYKSAIKQFEKHIKMSHWVQETAQSMIFIGQCYGYLGDPDKQIEWYYKAFTKDSSRRESLLQLCEYYRFHDDFQKVACLAEAALTIPFNNFYQNDIRHYRDVPHAYLYWAYWWLGNKEKSKFHYEKALEYDPNNPQYCWDARISEPWLNDLPDGWFSIVDIREYRRLISSLPDGARIAELGTWKGRSLCSIAELIKQKNITIVAIDTFKGSANEGNAHKEAEVISIEDELKKNLSKFGILDRTTIMAMTTTEASQKIDNQNFDFIFIDADHSYEAVKKDITNWSPKVKKGGTIGGHDYLWDGPRRVVNESFWGFHTANNIWSVKI